MSKPARIEVEPMTAKVGFCMPTMFIVTFAPMFADSVFRVTVGAPSTVSVAVAVSTGGLRVVPSVTFTVYVPATSAADVTCTPSRVFANVPAFETTTVPAV